MARSKAEKMMGAQIKALRMRKRLSLAQLGALVGLTKQGMSRIERGEVGPTPSRYEEIATALGVTLGELLSPRRERRPPPSRCTCSAV